MDILQCRNTTLQDYSQHPIVTGAMVVLQLEFHRKKVTALLYLVTGIESLKTSQVTILHHYTQLVQCCILW